MNKRKTILIIIIIIVGVFLFCKVSDSISVKLYKKYSKDGQYSVYGTKTFPDLLMPKMPGQGGDVEGTIYLYDEIENKILYSSKIPSIHLIYSSFEFSERTAYFVGDELVPNILTPWVLPRPIKNDYKKKINDTIVTYSPNGVILEKEIKKKDFYYRQTFNRKGIITMSYKSEKVKENKDKVSYFINEQKEFVSGRLDKVKYTISLEKEDEEIFVKCGNWIDYDGNGNIENIERYIPCECEKINFEEQKIKQLEEQKMENLKKNPLDEFYEDITNEK